MIIWKGTYYLIYLNIILQPPNLDLGNILGLFHTQRQPSHIKRLLDYYIKLNIGGNMSSPPYLNISTNTPHYQHTRSDSIPQQYLKHLFFSFASPYRSGLHPHQVQQLQSQIEHLYKEYKAKNIHHSILQGVWPFLTFYYDQVNGLTIYHQFLKIISPSKQQPDISNWPVVKAQAQELIPAEYGQPKRLWKEDAKFIKKLSVMQTKVNQQNDESLFRRGQAVFQGLNSQRILFEEMYQQFKGKYLQFKQKNMEEERQQKISQQISKCPFFNERLIKDQFNVSQPDELHNTLSFFNQQEYLVNQSYAHHNLNYLPIHKSKTLFPFPNYPEHQDYQEDQDYKQPVIKFICQKKNIHYTPSKRSRSTHPNCQQSKCQSQQQKFTTRNYKKRSVGETLIINMQERKVIKRAARHKIIDRCFFLEEKQNIVLRQMKNQKRKKEKDRIRKERLERTRRRIGRQSDDESYNKDRMIDQRHHFTPNRRHKQHQSDYQRQNTRRNIQMFNADSSEELQLASKMRNKMKLYKQWEQKYADDEGFVSQEQSMPKRTIISNNNKLDGAWRWLRNDLEELNEDRNGQRQHISNMQVRKFQLRDEVQSENMSVWVLGYLQKLQELQGKQVLSEGERVWCELMIRQKRSFDIDISIKVMSLLAIYCSNKSKKDWQLAYDRHIKHMLTYIIHQNLYITLFDILNNLFVSANNQHLQYLAKAHSYFKILFQFAQQYDKQCGMLALFKEIITEGMITPCTLGGVLKQGYFVGKQGNLRNPFKAAYSFLNFRLEQQDLGLALAISNLIFEELIMDSIEHKQGRYLRKLVNSLQTNDKMPKKQLLHLITYVQEYYIHYQPAISEEQFLLLVDLINISFQKIIMENLSHVLESRDIIKHIEFLSYLIRNEIERPMSNLTENQLLRLLLIKTKLRQKYDRPKMTLHLLIYAHFQQIITSYPQFQSKFTLISQWLLSNILSDFKFINKYPPELFQVIYSLTLNLYKHQIQSKAQKEAAEVDLGGVILKIFGGLVQSYDEWMKDAVKLEKNIKELERSKRQNNNWMQSLISNRSKSMIKLQSIQKTIICFLQTFLLNKVISSSPTHQLFALQFIINNQCFYKIFKYEQICTLIISPSLIEICSKTLITYFHFQPSLPSLIHERQMVEQSKIEGEGGIMQRQVWQKVVVRMGEYSFGQGRQQFGNWLKMLNETSSNDIMKAIAAISYMQVIYSLINTQNHENIILKFIKENITFTSLNLNPQKVQKSISLLQLLINNINSYLAAISNRLTYKQSHRMREQATQLTFSKCSKDISALVFASFTFRNVPGNQDLAIGGLLESMSLMEKVNINNLMNNPNRVYQHLMNCFQSSGNRDSITDLLWGLQEHFKRLGDLQKKMFVKGLNEMLQEMYKMFKRLNVDKGAVALQSIKVLNFILRVQIKLGQLLLQRIQGLVLGMKNHQDSNILWKIKLNEKNLTLILHFLNNLQNFTLNVYKIKLIKPAYLTLLTTIKPGTTEDSYCHHIKYVLRCCSQILNKQSRDLRFSMFVRQFISDILKVFMIPLISSDQTNLNKRRLEVFLEMMKGSQRERSVYENLLISNSKPLQAKIQLMIVPTYKYQANQRPIFQDILIDSIIGTHSDFNQLKVFLRDLLHKGCFSERSGESMLRLLSKVREFGWLSDEDGNLLSWCELQQKAVGGKLMFLRDMQE